MAAGPIDIQFPIAGVNRRVGFQRQPPFTTHDALNVRGIDALEYRIRGGSRAGLRKAYQEQLGSGSPVNLLATVRPVTTAKVGTVENDFQGAEVAVSTLSGWSLASWADDEATAGEVQHALGTTKCAFVNNPSIAVDDLCAYVHDAPSDFDTTMPYQISIDGVAPYVGMGGLAPYRFNGQYIIYGFLDNTTPAFLTDGWAFVVQLASYIYPAFTFTTKFVKYVSGVPTEVAGSGVNVNYNSVMDIKVYVNGTTLTGTVNGYTLATTTMTATGHRFGFGLIREADPQYPAIGSPYTAIENFGAAYQKTSTSGGQFTRKLVAGSNGLLYYENSVNQMTAVGGNLTLKADAAIQGQERAGKIYIADYGLLVSGTAGAITSSVLDDAAVSDWTALGIDTDDDVVVITAPAAQVGTYKITTIHATNGLTLDSGPANNTGIAYRVVRAPKVYDFDANTLSIWFATEGPQTAQVPSECPAVALYQDRLVLAGGANNPRAWYMSRAGDPLDWNLATDPGDIGAPIVGTSSKAGVIADNVVALISYLDNYLIFACENSLWWLRGNPVAGGVITNISDRLGVVHLNGWTTGPNGEVWMLTKQGLALFQGGTIELVSKDRIPDELMNVSSSTTDVSLELDHERREVKIFLTPTDGATATHWVYDIANGAFWPDELADADFQPMACVSHLYGPGQSEVVLLGCRDGYVRRFHRDQADDDGTAMDSYVWIGPIKLGGPGYSEGMLTEIQAVLANASGNVTWEVYVGDTPETAFVATALHDGTWSAGTNHRKHPRARGSALWIKITGAASQRWAVESVIGQIMSAGRFRKP